MSDTLEPTPFDDVEQIHVRDHLDPLYEELVGGNQLLEEILAEIRRGNSIERTGAVSSVKVTLQRGTVDVACHAYVGSDIQEAEDQALGSYRRVLEALNQDGVDAFGKTLETIKAKTDRP